MSTATSSARTVPTPPPLSHVPLPPFIDQLRSVTLPRFKVSAPYRLGLLLVAGAMLLLPLIYVALVAGVGYLTWLHVSRDLWIFDDLRSGARAKLGAYLTPIAAGGLLLLFMLKPLFARRRDDFIPMTLRREDEPLLFEFVDRLCRAVGAKSPSRIDVDTQVNASAGFKNGFAGLLRGDLVLTIGLPLVAGLTLEQFAGVLAHEFGHFAQGTALRLSFVIRSINNWFARIVLGRDSWDAALASSSKSAYVMLFVLLARLMIWVTRRILWCLMWAGHMISCFMLRQMEYDADRYEAALAGTDVFIQTTKRLPVLGLASHASFNDLQSAWTDRRLCDDLPALILANTRTIPPHVLAKLQQAATGAKTSFFDTHPADADRIASVSRTPTKPAFTDPRPATELFRDFSATAKVASMLFYRRVLGGAFHPQFLVPTSAVHKDSTARYESIESLRRFFGGHLSPTRLVFLPDEPLIATDLEAAKSELTEARLALKELWPATSSAWDAAESADATLLNVRLVEALLGGGATKLKAKDFNLPGTDAQNLTYARTSATSHRARAQHDLADVDRLAVQRLRAGLGLALSNELTGALTGTGPTTDDVVAMVGTLAALRVAYAGVLRFRADVRALGLLLKVLQSEGPHKQNPDLVRQILTYGEHVVGQLHGLRKMLQGIPYPFEHARKNIDIGTFLVRQLPGPRQVADVYHTADDALGNYFTLYARAMGLLVQVMERVEGSLGLPPLADPKPSADAPTPAAASA